MKKFTKLFGIIALVAVIGFSMATVFIACASTGGSSSDSSAAPATGQETIVFLGDSLTAGQYMTSDGKWLEDRSKAFPALLQNKVTIPVINAGVSGNTTAQGLARVKRDVLSHNPRIVVIWLSANDFLQKIPLSTTQKNLQKIIDMVNDGSRKIYLVRMYPNWSEQSMKMYDTLAASNNIELIEDIDWVGVYAHMSADGHHPNAAGHEILAENFFKALKPYLEANNLLKE